MAELWSAVPTFCATRNTSLTATLLISGYKKKTCGSPAMLCRLSCREYSHSPEACCLRRRRCSQSANRDTSDSFRFSIETLFRFRGIGLIQCCAEALGQFQRIIIGPEVHEVKPWL